MTETAKSATSSLITITDCLVNIYAAVALIAESWYGNDPVARVLALGFLLAGIVALRIAKAVMRRSV